MTEERLSGLAMMLIHRGTSCIPNPDEVYARKSNWRQLVLFTYVHYSCSHIIYEETYLTKPRYGPVPPLQFCSIPSTFKVPKPMSPQTASLHVLEEHPRIFFGPPKRMDSSVLA